MAESNGVHLSPSNWTFRIKLMKTVSFCSQDRIIGRPRNPYTPVTREANKSASVLSKPESSALAESRQQRSGLRGGGGLRCLCVILILGLVTTGKTESDYNHHQPFKRLLRDTASDRVIKENITAGAPTFTITIGDLFPIVGGSKSKSLWGTYWCPSSNPGKGYFNYPGYWFCGYWGCETIVTSDRWKPEKEDEFLRECGIGCHLVSSL